MAGTNRKRGGRPPPPQPTAASPSASGSGARPDEGCTSFHGHLPRLAPPPPGCRGYDPSRNVARPCPFRKSVASGNIVCTSLRVDPRVDLVIASPAKAPRPLPGGPCGDRGLSLDNTQRTHHLAPSGRAPRSRSGGVCRSMPILRQRNELGGRGAGLVVRLTTLERDPRGVDGLCRQTIRCRFPFMKTPGCFTAPFTTPRYS